MPRNRQQIPREERASDLLAAATELYLAKGDAFDGEFGQPERRPRTAPSPLPESLVPRPCRGDGRAWNRTTAHGSRCGSYLSVLSLAARR